MNQESSSKVIQVIFRPTAQVAIFWEVKTWRSCESFSDNWSL